MTFKTNKNHLKQIHNGLGLPLGIYRTPWSESCSDWLLAAQSGTDGGSETPHGDVETTTTTDETLLSYIGLAPRLDGFTARPVDSPHPPVFRGADRERLEPGGGV